MSTISLVVFDLDGTLVDSLRDIAESTNTLLEQYGGRPHGEEAIGRMVGDGAATLVARAFAAAAVPLPPDALARFLDIYNRRLLHWTRPYPGVEEMLDGVSRKATTAVLTNKPLGATRQILDGLGLAAYFGDRVLGGDGPRGRKPDPAGLLYLMAAAETTAEQTLMVGDSRADFETARSVEAPACMARYGFGFAGFRTSELRPSDRVIDRPLDVLSCL